MSADTPMAAVREVQVRAAGWRKRLYDAGWLSYALGTGSLGSVILLAGLFGHAGPLPPFLAIPFASLGLLTYLWPPLLLAGLVVGRLRTLGAGTARVQGGTLSVDGPAALRLPRAEIAQAAVVAGRGLRVEDRAGREIDLAMDVDDAYALLEPLALEPSQHRYRFAWRNRRARWGSFVLAFLALSFLASLPMMLAGAAQPSMVAMGCMLVSSPWLVAELVSRWWSSRSLEIGLDGVLSKSREGRALLRFEDIRDVASDGEALTITTNDGTVHRVLTDVDDEAMRRAMLDRLREARAIAKSRGSESSVALALLERGSRSLGTWRGELASILTAAKGFRAASVGADDLAVVMDDTSATTEQRIAAAIALGAVPENRARIRVAAETSVSPKLRVAFDALAQGEHDDAIFEAALEEAAEAEEREARAR
ncbi:MAG: hypothetical protein J0L92_21975 [Deltaproteobacteria bacterium]|nr:hypothetical protein [Deltaproteobacteria bacterium]